MGRKNQRKISETPTPNQHDETPKMMSNPDAFNSDLWSDFKLQLTA